MPWWKRIFGKTDDAPRATADDLPPVEHLESRLCLGSMQASAVADWGLNSLDGLSHASDVLLENRLDESDDEQTQREPNNPPIPHRPTNPQRSTPRPVAIPTDPTANQTSASLPGALPTWAPTAHRQANPPQSNVANANNQQADGIGQLPNNAGASIPVTAAIQNNASGQSTAANQSVQSDSQTLWTAEALGQLGLVLTPDGGAIGLAGSLQAQQSGYDAWWISADEPVVIRYDFRDQNGFTNEITNEQITLAEQSLQRWADATDNKIVFQRDTEASAEHIINIGVGDLAAFGHVSEAGGFLGLGGGRVIEESDGELVASGIAWLDRGESWDIIVGNGDPANTIDFSTVVSHEIGHTLGYGDQAGRTGTSVMEGTYTREQQLSAIDNAHDAGEFYRTIEQSDAGDDVDVMPMTLATNQLSADEVRLLLNRASAATKSKDAIIAVVDRHGRILGVRVEEEAAIGGAAGIPDQDTLVFAIDGAVAKARTAALFSNGDPANGTLAPLTSRTIRILSQSTVTQREVESNPNKDNNIVDAPGSTTRGPGFVAPIGVGGHFPPDINFTPLVDLFAIEHTNRDSNIHPGPDGIKGTGDDINLRTTGTASNQTGRFNATNITAGTQMFAPESFGHAQNSGLLPNAQSRGIATLPGGVPLFKDLNGDGLGDGLVGGIGVFFPGADGFATHEQGFVAGVGQSTLSRTNASRVLEAEFIAYAAAGGSATAQAEGIIGAKIGAINGQAAVTGLDLPFGRLDLVGITLEVFGPIAGREGLRQLLQVGNGLTSGGVLSGALQQLDNPDPGAPATVDARPGIHVQDGFLVDAHDSPSAAAVKLLQADVEQIINRARIAADEVRAAVRLPLSSKTRMVFAVTDTDGEVLGLFRMLDATVFSVDVAVAKARNVAYYADAADLQAQDQVVAAGTAFTNRTFRYLAQPRFPSGIDGTPPPAFSILNDGNINNLTAENNGAPDPVSAFTSVLGNDAFFPSTNFRDPGDGTVVDNGGVVAPLANQNGIVFFPGSTPLYKNGVLVGGLGVSGDGVDQDDVVTFLAALGFEAKGNAPRADQTFVDGVRLPFQHFLRNPFG